ncbi:membrane protease YdiL (CAAX protease family) [Microbacterium resistens]|uniref:Membrane protease YdiL (CAAX protease family) n=1 Tax=Microbacterium resistens TaxID=156977 RepID=A0ABU1SF73_9MICO|nr:CPBP family intramembrane glutamic endopeptidase [Microbacterium resistens]MDR6868254.1 membrane protease YdiL (CAAX protease family) [Microbacterium resistens]
MTVDHWRALGFGVAVHILRFGVIVGVLALAPLLGVSGWYLGFAVNVACVLLAVVIVTMRGQWRASGLFSLWRGRTAALFLVPFIVEVLLWAVPSGLVVRPPGFGLWALTLLLVGLNEELISRVVVLERMRRSFGPAGAVVLTGALFGLQHLSAFATTARTADDVLLNVLISACYGIGLAAFQYRFRWVLPLVLIHAAADFTTILSANPLPDAAVALTCAVFLATAAAILRPMIRAGAGSPGRGPAAR